VTRERTPLRCCLVGPGRRRRGLGPFLARAAERAGLRVVAAAGRDLDRTRGDTAALARDLGHPIAAWDDVAAMLAGERPHAVVIASPPHAHLAALDACLAAGVHVLCEKPLVDEGRTREVPRLCAGFAAAGLVLMENCQWPFVLPAWEALHPGRTPRERREVELGLSPTEVGRGMVEESLSHLLSLCQAVVPVVAATRLVEVEYSTRAAGAEAVTLTFGLRGPHAAVDARLVLRRCLREPRPAWLSIDGARIDRRVRMPEYAISFVGGGTEIPADDPLDRIVYRFAELVTESDVERTRNAAAGIDHRARLYAEILAAW
jgi:hypothetical protein